MDRLVKDMVKAFNSFDNRQALRIADQLVTKQKKAIQKKSRSLQPQDYETVLIIKTICHMNLSQLHLGHSMMKDHFMTPQKIKKFLSDRSAVLATNFYFSLDPALQFYLTEYLNQFKNDQDLHPFLLLNNLLNQLSLIYFQAYARSKKLSFLVSHLQILYLKMTNPHSYSYGRSKDYDPIIGHSTQIVKSFIEKCLKEIGSQLAVMQDEEKRVNTVDQLLDLKEDLSTVARREEIEKELNGLGQMRVDKKNLQHLKAQVIDLKVKIHMHEGQYRKIQPLIDSMDFPFKYLTVIKEHCFDIYVAQMQKVFRKNLCFETYTPLYEYYDQFLKQVIRRGYKVTQQLKELPKQQLYMFKIEGNVLQTYYNSLHSEYNMVIKQEVKSDYYYICLKGLLLQLLSISNAYGFPKTKFLAQYIRLFSRTLSFSNELQQYWCELSLIYTEPDVSSIDSLISHINFTKISLSSLKLNSEHVLSLLANYKRYRGEIEHNRHLSKGERYVADEYLIIVSDIIRHLILCETDVREIEAYHTLIIRELEEGMKTSPYNADIKLRYMHFCVWMGYYDEVYSVFHTLDIKSVQWETLSFWIINAIIQYGLDKPETVKKIINSYQDNNKETAVYANKALKACQLQSLQQFMLYRQYTQRSYSKVMVFFASYLTFRLEASVVFYLMQIRTILQQGNISFSCDYRVMQNVCFAEEKFCQFYGVYNNSQILLHQVYIRLNQDSLIANITNKPYEFKTQSIEQLMNHRNIICSIRDIYTFKNYVFPKDKIDKTHLPLQTPIILEFYHQTIDLKCNTVCLGLLLKEKRLQEVRQRVEIFNHLLRDTIKMHEEMNMRLKSKMVFILRRCLMECWSLLDLLARHYRVGFIGEIAEQCLACVRSWEQEAVSSDRREMVVQRNMQFTKAELNNIKIKYQSAYK